MWDDVLPQGRPCAAENGFGVSSRPPSLTLPSTIVPRKAAASPVAVEMDRRRSAEFLEQPGSPAVASPALQSLGNPLELSQSLPSSFPAPPLQHTLSSPGPSTTRFADRSGPRSSSVKGTANAQKPAVFSWYNPL